MSFCSSVLNLFPSQHLLLFFSSLILSFFFCFLGYEARTYLIPTRLIELRTLQSMALNCMHVCTEYMRTAPVFRGGVSMTWDTGILIYDFPLSLHQLCRQLLRILEVSTLFSRSRSGLSMNEKQWGRKKTEGHWRDFLTKYSSDLWTWICKYGRLFTEHHCWSVGVVESWNCVYRMSNVCWPASYPFNLSYSFLIFFYRSHNDWTQIGHHGA